MTTAIDQGASWAIDQGASWATDEWAGNLEDAQQEAGAETSDRREALGRTVDSFASEFGIYPRVVGGWDDLTVEERNAEVYEYRLRLLNFYDLAYDHQYGNASASQTDTED